MEVSLRLGSPGRGSKRQSPWGRVGDFSRRPGCMEINGNVLTKVGEDFKHTVAISRIQTFRQFHCEVLVHRVMRGTRIGLVVPGITLEQDWSIPSLVQKELAMKEKAVEDHKAEVELAREERIAKLAEITLLPRAERGKLEQKLQMTNDELHRRGKILKNDLSSSREDIKSRETQMEDDFGPRVWYLSNDGYFFAGLRLVKTGVSFVDGSRVEVVISNNVLTFMVDGVCVPGAQAEMGARAIFAVALQNKGACLEITTSTLDETEATHGQGALEDFDHDNIAEEHSSAASPIDTFDRYAPTLTNGESALRVLETEEEIAKKRSEKFEIAQARRKMFTDAAKIDPQAELGVKEIAMIMVQKWGKIEKLFKAIQKENKDDAGKFQFRDFESVMHKMEVNDQRIRIQLTRVWYMLTSCFDASPTVLCQPLIDRTIQSMRMEDNDEGAVDDGVTWGTVHSDMSVTGRTVTSNNVSSCVALLSKSLYVKGKMQVKFLIQRMSGSMFVGAVDALRVKESTDEDKTVINVETVPLDANWFYADIAPRSAWYMSDLGAMRRGNETIRHVCEQEFKTGDVITMDIQIGTDSGSISFAVNDKPIREMLTGLSGEIFAAVMIAGDVGDAVTLLLVDLEEGGEPLGPPSAAPTEL